MVGYAVGLAAGGLVCSAFLGSGSENDRALTAVILLLGVGVGSWLSSALARAVEKRFANKKKSG
jgi:hypothetical protein